MGVLYDFIKKEYLSQYNEYIKVDANKIKSEIIKSIKNKLEHVSELSVLEKKEVFSLIDVFGFQLSDSVLSKEQRKIIYILEKKKIIKLREFIPTTLKSTMGKRKLTHWIFQDIYK